MKIIKSGTNERIERGTAAALGIFDGVHMGHRSTINAAVEKAVQCGLEPAVFTFATSTVTSKGKFDQLLTDGDKLLVLEKLGIKYAYSADFAQLKDMTPERFVREILREKLNVRWAVCGENFHFGKGGKADPAELKRLCGEQGIETYVVPPLKTGGERISSTRIRDLIRSGGIAAANEMLGYRFTLRLKVVHGAHLGSTWDFPTINQEIPERLIKPRFGVYCVKVHIGGKEYAGVCNVGVKPTLGKATPPLAETFIIDYSGDLYGQVIPVEFYEFVRPEIKFADFDDLKAEIGRNTKYTKRYFGMM